VRVISLFINHLKIKKRQETTTMMCRRKMRKALLGTAGLMAANLWSGSGFAQTDSLTQNKAQVMSIGDSLERGGEPLHILYVHGIGATGPGDSSLLRQSICKFLKDCTSPAGDFKGREFADQGEFGLNAKWPTLTYMGAPIWSSQVEWNASAPFVDHWVISRKAKNGSAKSILVDELNWWPLVFPLKCRNILVNEAALAGTDGTFLDDCAQQVPDPGTSGRFDSYPWISSTEAKNLESERSRAVFANRMVKVDLMDWGFSDAMMAVGPMRQLLIDSIRQLLLKSVQASGEAPAVAGSFTSSAGRSAGTEYIVISHSLGSFLVFSALNLSGPDADASMARSNLDPALAANTFDYVMQHTSQVYFFANQVPLLELAMLGGGTSTSGGANHALAVPSQPGSPSGSSDPEPPNYVADLSKWTSERTAFIQSHPTVTATNAEKPQIVAWSDPNDLLSWHVPDLAGATVVNLYAKNSFRWFWLFENPLGAHDNYAKNNQVIKSLLKPRQAGAAK
jgi:hypothetical protein